MINTATMNPILNDIPAIFTIGNKHTTILATGHYSEGLIKFIKDHFKSLNIESCNNNFYELRQ